MSHFKLSSRSRKRIPRIIEGLLNGESHQEIAEACGLKNRRTIERDLQAWQDSGGLERFLQNEWLRMHGKIRQSDPQEAYRQLSKLLGKTLTQKVETAMTAPVIVKMWKPQKEESGE